jgi:hypothetical protein
MCGVGGRDSILEGSWVRWLYSCRSSENDGCVIPPQGHQVQGPDLCDYCQGTVLEAQ